MHCMFVEIQTTSSKNKESHLTLVCFISSVSVIFWHKCLFISTLLSILLQTGDKSSEATARMNLSDLRLVVGLKSNSNIHPHIFRNTDSSSSALAASFRGSPNLSGTPAVLRMSFSAQFRHMHSCWHRWSKDSKIFKRKWKQRRNVRSFMNLFNAIVWSEEYTKEIWTLKRVKHTV